MSVQNTETIASVTEVLRNKILMLNGVGSGDIGYGQNVIVNQNIQEQNLTNIGFTTYNNNFKQIINHQTGGSGDVSNNVLPIPVSGDEVKAVDYDAYADRIDTLTNTRFNYQMSSMTVFNNVHAAIKNAWWGPRATITAEVDLIWADENRARYFFNTSGQIRLKPSQPTWSYVTGYHQDRWGRHPYQYRSGGYWWQIALELVGTIVFDAHSTVSNGSVGSAAANIGYYELTNAYRRIFDGTNFYNPYANIPGYNDIDDFYIDAMKVPKGMRFRIQMAEQNRDQRVDPGTRVDFSLLKATTYMNNPAIQSPSFITRTNF